MAEKKDKGTKWIPFVLALLGGFVMGFFGFTTFEIIITIFLIYIFIELEQVKGKIK